MKRTPVTAVDAGVCHASVPMVGLHIDGGIYWFAFDDPGLPEAEHRAMEQWQQQWRAYCAMMARKLAEEASKE